MNLLQHCSFIDRHRSNTSIELDDIIEENYKKNQSELFHIILYFTANWLPDASNKQLNKKLERFYTSKNSKRKSNKTKPNFELIFISSDKTKISYDQFLNANKYIRYALSFDEQELKSQLCKYFKIYGIPYLTLVSLKLDSSLKILDFRIDKSNIKQAFLDDENGDNFPWTNEAVKSTNEITITSSIKKSIIKSTESNSESDKKISQNFSNESCLNIEQISDIYFEFLEEIVENLSPINVEETQMIVNTYSHDFLFILFGSNESEINSVVIENLAEFWRKFHVKHKFIVVYLNFDSEPFKNMPYWFTVMKNNMKNKIASFYEINCVPKLVVLDMGTGHVLNDHLRIGIIEYIQEFCAKQVKIAQKDNKNYLTNHLTPKNIKNFDFAFDYNKNSKKTKKKKIDRDLLNQLEENLIKISIQPNLENQSSEASSGIKKVYLLYFCSNYTVSNSIVFENIIQFLSLAQEKSKFHTNIILISSDASEENYNELISKMNTFNLTRDCNEHITSKIHNFDRLALSFSAKSVKENLFEQMNVIGIPWFSLIDATNGEILCENLNIFILNSQLRDMVF